MTKLNDLMEKHCPEYSVKKYEGRCLSEGYIKLSHDRLLNALAASQLDPLVEALTAARLRLLLIGKKFEIELSLEDIDKALATAKEIQEAIEESK